MPTGRFLLRGYVDLNRNNALDERELFDSVTVNLIRFAPARLAVRGT
jgi:hypothetical protein